MFASYAVFVGQFTHVFDKISKYGVVVGQVMHFELLSKKGVVAGQRISVGEGFTVPIVEPAGFEIVGGKFLQLFDVGS